MDNVTLLKSLYDAFGHGGTYKATGKRMDAQACHVWDVKDGKVTRFQQYIDTAKVRDAMGVR